MERLQKIIAESGICSRRKAEQLILDGKVKVNGKVIKELGTKAEFSDEILVNNKPIKKEEKIVYIINKPKGVISSVSDDRDRRCVVDLIDSDSRLYPIGRLDYDSSGLLLITNDGALTQSLLHPKFEIDKTYEVTIDKILTSSEISKIEKGVHIENYISAPAKVEIVKKENNKMYLLVTIHEGRNREIRKMFQTVGATVTRLHRIKEANIELGNLKSGEYRRLKPFELKKLKAFINS